MAKASISYVSEEFTVSVAVESTTDYPDSAADVILRAVELYRMVVPDAES